MNKFSLKILKTSMEKSPESKLQRINLLSIASNERSPKQMADCDLLPHSPVMQHQVNCPPSAFIEVWSMSQTRGIRQVCQILFNE